MRTAKATLAALALLAIATAAQAQSMRPYKDGPVVDMTYVRTEPGRFDDYMRHLGGTYKKNMEANIKAGLVVSYQVLTVAPRTPADPDVILSVTYPNMATFDKSEEFDKVSTQNIGPIDAQNKAFADRGAMRRILGSTLTREAILK